MLSKKSKKRTKKGQTKADFIRQRSAKTPAEIMADAKKLGVKLTMGQIYSQRSADKAKAKGPRGGARKTGRRGAGGRRAAAGMAGAEQQLRVAIAKLGLDRARAILDDVESAFLGG